MKNHTIFYQLINTNGKLRLKLWEPSSTVSRQGPRHRFAINYLVSSELEAQQLVAQYVRDNRAKARCLA
ncbi:hypothetical protein [Almyronema epifaneia]|uniref:WGR domain-containing protein n=1 Tax=Almyronema epifaneia S1 TaxID=2991925 RepID=A0ABW6IAE4_9CYAN